MNHIQLYLYTYLNIYLGHIINTLHNCVSQNIHKWTLRSAGTRFAWDCGPIGATQYNKVKVSGPKGRIVAHSGGDSDGFAMTELEIQAQHTDAETEDSVSIQFS